MYAHEHIYMQDSRGPMSHWRGQIPTERDRALHPALTKEWRRSTTKKARFQGQIQGNCSIKEDQAEDEETVDA